MMWCVHKPERGSFSSGEVMMLWLLKPFFLLPLLTFMKDVRNNSSSDYDTNSWSNVWKISCLTTIVSPDLFFFYCYHSSTESHIWTCVRINNMFLTYVAFRLQFEIKDTHLFIQSCLNPAVVHVTKRWEWSQSLPPVCCVRWFVLSSAVKSEMLKNSRRGKTREHAVSPLQGTKT